ncbi:MAG: ABC transporter ATP-binding protein [Candidatus Thorarchaeota archaeon]
MAILEVSDLHKTFFIPRAEDIEVLKGISMNVEKGEFIAIMGPSGSGKSTLLNIIASIEEITKGIVLVDKTDLSRADLVENRRHITSLIFQDFNLLPHLTAVENVMFPMMLTGIDENEARKNALELLTRVNLVHRADHTPDDLSGGEQQRVGIARALANSPKILLADEPTGNLDTKTGQQIIQLFRDITKLQGITVIMVTHDLAMAEQADRILILRGGKLHQEHELLEEIG